MHIIVLGAGIVGVTTAYFLHEKGYTVTVVDRQSDVAAETSIGNAGHVCPSYATPWAAPGMKGKSLKWSVQSWLGMEAALRFTPRLDPHQWRWLSQFLSQCNAERYAVNKARMGRLARYSHTQLKAIRERLDIQYEQTTVGNLQLFRTQEGMDNAGLAAKVLAEAGVAYELLDGDGCVAFDPALRDARDQLVGGMLLPQDETGNCPLFARALADWLKSQGVNFVLGTAVQQIEFAGGAVTGLRTAAGVLKADAYVVACASASVALVKPLGLQLPVYPVKGYAITVPVSDPDAAPKSGVMDEYYKVAITRMGSNIRAAGTAEIGSWDTKVTPRDCATAIKSLKLLFPRGADLGKIEYWAGLRPMTPDGAPLIGATSYSNLYLNAGHGSNGWTTACGSSRLIADKIAGVATEITSDDLSPLRAFQ
ncbi:D-amino acid dehydrogenase small subunit [Herbaspirillum sp. meg3]|jgi:D-amino-acid dehydrogenase|uniref:D-amino acid dehydrogenase n=1 Tax=Herbaspirillum sp. meg3 TaxID=2025949 RepID=UPI000B98C288|nr:D-amino acid dehydrogenase [Herbaspirillum sp. meg3]ASU36840.1 D-amino acid dehydrogenase small subunit [Herbaspirillum sp. meg3]